MAVLKKDTIIFSSGRQIKVPGGILAITRSLEIADYYSRNILFYNKDSKRNKEVEAVTNLYNLTSEELIEIADAMIQLWIGLKDNVRRFGIKSEEIFKNRS